MLASLPTDSEAVKIWDGWHEGGSPLDRVAVQ